MCVDPVVIDSDKYQSQKPTKNPRYFDANGLFLTGNPGRPLGSNRVKTNLEIFLKGIEDMAPDVLPIGREVLLNGSIKDKLIIWKTYVDKFIPEEIVHKHLSLLIKGDLQGLTQHTQEYGEFLTWKAQRQLEAQGVVDVAPSISDDEIKPGSKGR